MVDFQSRDTHRGRDDEGADESDAEPAADTDEAASAEAKQDGDSAAPEADTDRGFAVVTVAGDRTIEEDESGAAAVEAIDAAGDRVVTRELIDPNYDGVQKALDSLADRRDVYALLTVGGTGVEPRDVTIEAIRPMLAKELPGFGELVRRQCYDTVGTAVIRTRATAGILDGTVCFCLPGDADIVEPGVRDVVLPEAEYIAALASRDDS